jgi:hypothetical protein
VLKGTLPARSQIRTAPSVHVVMIRRPSDDIIYIHEADSRALVSHPYDGAKWLGGPPLVGVGQAFWVAKAKPGTWQVKGYLPTPVAKM